MTGWVLRLEVRRSAARLAAALSLPLVFLVFGVPGQGLRVVLDDARTELLLLVALALGLGAWQARRDRRSRMVDLLATTARPSWLRRLHIALPLGLGAMTGFLAVFAGLVGYGVATGVYVPPLLVPPAVAAALALAAGVWLGAAIGRALPLVWVPPLIVVAGLVGMTTLAIVTDPEGRPGGLSPGAWLLNPSGTEGFDEFETLTTAVQVAQVWWMVALAAACLVLFVAAGFVRLLAVVPIGLGAVVAGTLLPTYLHEGVTLDRGALALVCTDDEPLVCARRVHPRLVDQLREPGREALAILAAELPQAPTRVVQRYSTNDSRPPPLERPVDVLYVEVFPGVSGTLDVSERDLLWTLLMGAGTPICEDALNSSTFERYNAARLVAAAWLLEEPPLAPSDPDGYWGWLPPTSISTPAYEALLALPADEQRSRVAALRAAELECGPGDRLALLTGAGAPPS
jgi:hypothetical protein